MRAEMKQKCHAGHLGINSCLRRARELLFWPGMSAEIRQYVQACATCATYADRQPAEPLIITEVPKRPWQRVATDIFSWGGNEYLVTVDQHSSFFEVDKLNGSTSDAVISRLRGHFARYGIPDILISDNGPQFSSSMFRKFVKDWAFTHKTISPGNSQANGAAEAAVKIMKRLMRKCKASGEDLLLGLLNMRNISTEGLNTSPAQRLLGRRTKATVPTTEALLRPSYTYSHYEAQKKEDKKLRRQGKGRELSQLHVGSNVWIQPLRPHAREWEEATVRKRLTGRSYEVENASGQRYRRNRRFIRQTIQPKHSFPIHQPRGTIYNHSEIERLTPDNATNRQNEMETPADQQDPNERPISPIQTRSGRVIRKPVRYCE